MLHVYWPVTACLTLFVIVGIIMIMFRFGPKLCKLRHTTLPEDEDWEEKAYEQKVSYGGGQGYTTFLDRILEQCRV